MFGNLQMVLWEAFVLLSHGVVVLMSMQSVEILFVNVLQHLLIKMAFAKPVCIQNTTLENIVSFD